jgi:hypothetical protein
MTINFFSLSNSPFATSSSIPIFLDGIAWARHCYIICSFSSLFFLFSYHNVYMYKVSPPLSMANFYRRVCRIHKMNSPLSINFFFFAYKIINRTSHHLLEVIKTIPTSFNYKQMLFFRYIQYIQTYN